jgi:Lon protease-like protein
MIVDELPTIIPIFPLPNLVLFPGVKVPLHIFEPRYREMVAEVSATHRIIGMMLLKGDWERDYYDRPDIFQVGCAGRIGNLVPLPDGRFNLILEGMIEFRIVQERRDRSFRRAQVAWCPVETGALDLDGEAMESLRALLVRYIGSAAGDAWRAAVEDRGLRGASLVNFLCFYLDLTTLEKQTLLEALGARAKCLFDVLTFRLEERKLGPRGQPGGGSGVVQ